MQRFFSTVKAHLLREPRRSVRDSVVTACGAVVVLLALLYQGLPQAIRVLLLSVGTLNFFAGMAELVPENRVLLAGVLRSCFYVAVLWAAVVAVTIIA